MVTQTGCVGAARAVRWIGGARAPLGASVEKMLQGGIADALTHIGQIALLRRLAQSAVRDESYARAEIAAGRVGPEQAPPRREFDRAAARSAAPGRATPSRRRPGAPPSPRAQCGCDREATSRPALAVRSTPGTSMRSMRSPPDFDLTPYSKT